MVNNTIATKSDPLVSMHVHVLQSQKEFVDSQLDGSSSYIRQLISAQMEGYGLELSKLTEEEKELELKLNQVKAQKNQILEAINKTKESTQNRDRLFNEQVAGLVDILKGKGGLLSQMDKAISSSVNGMNAKMNGNGSQPFNFEEVKNAVIKAAVAQGVELF